MTYEEKIERILEQNIPIYRHDIPELGIIKDCLQKRMTKNMQRNALRISLIKDAELMDKMEKCLTI